MTNYWELYIDYKGFVSGSKLAKDLSLGVIIFRTTLLLSKFPNTQMDPDSGALNSQMASSTASISTSASVSISVSISISISVSISVCICICICMCTCFVLVLVLFHVETSHASGTWGPRFEILCFELMRRGHTRCSSSSSSSSSSRWEMWLVKYSGDARVSTHVTPTLQKTAEWAIVLHGPWSKSDQLPTKHRRRKLIDQWWEKMHCRSIMRQIHYVPTVRFSTKRLHCLVWTRQNRIDKGTPILHYTMLYYTILYYAILYYTILCYAMLYHTIPYHTMTPRK